jgi:DNA-binding transcriptional LysR family regulator
MDRFLEMQVFNAVVEEGSFVKAAESLNLSKAAVSRHVQDLETRLGVRLIQRTTRRLSLTSDGQIFFARSKSLLEDLVDAELEVASRSQRASGLLRINVPVSFGVSHLAPVWGQFRDLHPGVKLDITLTDRVVDLVEEGFDMAVRIGQLESSSLVSRMIATSRLVLCASPHYLAIHGQPSSPKDLINHAVVAYSYATQKDDWQLMGPEGPVIAKTQPVIHANSGETCRAIAVSSQGIILQPLFIVDEELKAGRLVPVLPQYRAAELGIYVVYPSRQHLSTKVRALVDFLSQYFTAHPLMNQDSIEVQQD